MTHEPAKMAPETELGASDVLPVSVEGFARARKGCRNWRRLVRSRGWRYCKMPPDKLGGLLSQADKEPGTAGVSEH